MGFQMDDSKPLKPWEEATSNNNPSIDTSIISRHWNLNCLDSSHQCLRSSYLSTSKLACLPSRMKMVHHLGMQTHRNTIHSFVKTRAVLARMANVCPMICASLSRMVESLRLLLRIRQIPRFSHHQTRQLLRWSIWHYNVSIIIGLANSAEGCRSKSSAGMYVQRWLVNQR